MDKENVTYVSLYRYTNIIQSYKRISGHLLQNGWGIMLSGESHIEKNNVLYHMWNLNKK